MQRRVKYISIKALCVIACLCCAVTAAGVWAMARPRTHAREALARKYLMSEVRRADLFPTLKASGRVESVKRTVIECDLENVAVGVRGQRLTSGGAAILLSVIPEGSTVKQGDVLAVIDSSEYEELLRIQQMAVERAAADHVQASLDLEVAKLAVREFEEGTLRETMEDFEGKIFLARSDLERAKDRVAWAHRMKEKGYIPAAALSRGRLQDESVQGRARTARICIRCF